jgi:hypothetical protein
VNSEPLSQEHDAGHVPAARRRRHLDRRRRDLGVVVLGDGEPRDAPRAEVEHRGQVELPWSVGISVRSPQHLALMFNAVKSRVTRSATGCAAFVGPRQVVTAALRTPVQPWAAIECATVFLETTQPSFTRSSRTLGAP